MRTPPARSGSRTATSLRRARRAPERPRRGVVRRIERGVRPHRDALVPAQRSQCPLMQASLPEHWWKHFPQSDSSVLRSAQ